MITVAVTLVTCRFLYAVSIGVTEHEGSLVLVVCVFEVLSHSGVLKTLAWLEGASSYENQKALEYKTYRRRRS